LCAGEYDQPEIIIGNGLFGVNRENTKGLKPGKGVCEK